MAGSRDQGNVKSVVDTLFGLDRQGEKSNARRLSFQTVPFVGRERVGRVVAPLGFREGSLMPTKLLRGGRDLLGIAPPLAVGNERE